ncbi:leucine-rich repeat-containing protein 74B-like isoform X2 [Dreissena polymorpha]|uniref:leucine-rich repeat-containing protein 74B-like isoform X2 n=1 Tax=Dreissena polymorpha TaxID=45954 RepID=UPI002264B45D|nr:leucine-rich repeat-containing protein 74B-like isoform X2 [Dreissena polymorpha]
MENRVEFPDAELAKSPTLGTVFRIPSQVGDTSGDEDDHVIDKDDARSRLHVRPQSAKGPNLDLPSRVLPSKPQGIRPWSAQPKSSKTPMSGQRKVFRHTLRKPHLQPPSRSSTASISSEASSLITAVGLENNVNKSGDTGAPEIQSRHVRCSHVHSQDKHNKWVATISELPSEEQGEDTPKKPPPEERPMKKHPSFETWIEGSPHDSEEYDTDLDIEDFVKKEVKEERPLDPTGTVMYMDQCETQGLVPVSYLRRHLGDRNLRMRHHYVGGSGTKPIAVALLKNTVTEALDISDNYLEAEGARYIAGMMRDNAFITNLNISNNFIGKDGFTCICRMLESNTTLKTLCVAGNQLSDLSAQGLVEGLKNNTSLTSLDLSGNNFGEIGGLYIGAALGLNDGLLDLDLSWNSIRNRGASAVLAALTKNRMLESLDLSWNGLGAPGAEALKQGLKVNSKLKVLDLTNNRLTTKAADAIAWGLSRNAGLETLVLNLNPLKDASVETILKAAEKSKSLNLLSIEEVGISPANYAKVKELQASREMTILHGGVGGYTRTSSATSMLQLFGKFVASHSQQLLTACQQFDPERKGWVPLDDLKWCLKESGLRLTNRQLNTVIDELNTSNGHVMNYKDIVSGETMKNHFKKRPSRAVAIRNAQITINTVPDLLRRQLTVS